MVNKKRELIMTQSNILLNSAEDSEKKNVITFLREDLNDLNIFHKDANQMRSVQKISVAQL